MRPTQKTSAMTLIYITDKRQPMLLWIGKDVDARPPFRLGAGHMSMIVTATIGCGCIRKPGRKIEPVNFKPFGGSIGSSADEGRAKLRYVPGNRMEVLIRELPNGTSCIFGYVRISDREPAELKHLSKQRKRNQRDWVSKGDRKPNRANRIPW